MFLFSGQGVFVILIIALLLFGPDKLPQIGRTVGRFMKEFKRAQEAMELTIRAEMYDKGAEEPAATPVAFSQTASDEDDEEEDEE